MQSKAIQFRHLRCVVREHPFNLKGRAMVFFGVKIFFSLRSAAEFFYRDFTFL